MLKWRTHFWWWLDRGKVEVANRVCWSGAHDFGDDKMTSGKLSGKQSGKVCWSGKLSGKLSGKVC